MNNGLKPPAVAPLGRRPHCRTEPRQSTAFRIYPWREKSDVLKTPNLYALVILNSEFFLLTPSHPMRRFLRINVLEFLRWNFLMIYWQKLQKQL